MFIDCRFFATSQLRQPPRSRTARWSRAARRRTDRSIRQSRLGRSDQGSHGGPRSRCSTAAASAGSDYPQSLARRRSEGVSPSALCSSLTTRHKIPPSVADGAERPPRKTRGTGSEACAYPQKHAVPFTMHTSPDAPGHGGKMMRRTRRAELGPTASSWSQVPSS